MEFIEADDFLKENSFLSKSIVLFSSEDCEFCEVVREQLNNHVLGFINENIRVFEVEVSEDVSRNFSVTRIPSVSVFKNGVEFFTKIGVFDEENVEEDVNGFLDSVNKVFGEVNDVVTDG